MEVQHVLLWSGNICAKLNMRFLQPWILIGSHVAYLTEGPNLAWNLCQMLYVFSLLWVSHSAGIRVYLHIVGHLSHIVAAPTKAVAFIGFLFNQNAPVPVTTVNLQKRWMTSLTTGRRCVLLFPSPRAEQSEGVLFTDFNLVHISAPKIGSQIRECYNSF